MARQQVRFDGWHTEFNDDRPHEALDRDVTGVALHAFTASDAGRAARAGVPGPLRGPVPLEGRNVRFKAKQFFVSQTLSHEHVGLEETADGVWDLYFFDRLLARLDERTWRLTA